MVQATFPLSIQRVHQHEMKQAVNGLCQRAYRNINWRLTAAYTSGRDVHEEHEAIFRAAISRQEARAALALESHIRLTHDIVRHQASQAKLKIAERF